MSTDQLTYMYINTVWYFIKFHDIITIDTKEMSLEYLTVELSKSGKNYPTRSSMKHKSNNFSLFFYFFKKKVSVRLDRRELLHQAGEILHVQNS